MMYYVISPYGHIEEEFPYGPIGYTGSIEYQGTCLSQAITINKISGYPIFTFNSDSNRLEPVNLK